MIAIWLTEGGPSIVTAVILAGAVAWVAWIVIRRRRRT
jgi:hypothetical protein